MKKSGRYKTSHLVEDQYEPGSRHRVLRNLHGIKSRRDMDQIETIALKQVEDKIFRTYDQEHQFTADDLCQMHKLWLGGIYEWAGRYRQVNLTKNDFPFAAVNQVPRLMTEFEKGVLREYTPCRLKAAADIAEALAKVHTELVLIHPFREGNGRFARLLATLMALQSGVPLLDFKPMLGRNRAAYFGPCVQDWTTIISRCGKSLRQ